MTDVVTDAVVFAKTVLGIDVFDYQEKTLRTEAHVIAGCGGRRSGKTLCSQVKSLHTVMARRDAQVIVTSANEGSVRRWIGECRDLLSGTDLGRGAMVDIEAMKITFQNGSEIIGVSPTAASLRGYGRKVFGVVIDEASLCARNVWPDVRFVLLDNIEKGAWAFMVGPPSCSSDHWFRVTWNAGQRADPDVFAFQWATTLNPKLDGDWLRREIDRLNSIEKMGEIDGLWVEDGLQMFSHKLLESVTADLELPALRKLVGPARPIASFDFGISYDSSAACYVYRLPVRTLNPDADPRKPVFVVVPFIWPAGEMLINVVNEIVDCPAPAYAYGLEENGISGMPSQEVQRRILATKPVRHGDKRVWNSAATTQAKKIVGYSTWRWLFERGQAVIPRHPLLIRQLAGLKIDTSGRGGKIEAEDPATHDDAADCLMLGALPYTKIGQAKVRSRLAELASVNAVAEAPAPLLDVPVVSTGAGLRVHSRPPLQSVVDQRVSLPAGVAPMIHRDTRYDGIREEVAAALAG